MEPFDLTFHPVTSNDDPSTFDSFNNVVNYDTSFKPTDQALPLSAYNINTVQYTWTDYVSPASSGLLTTSGGIQTGRTTGSTYYHQPVWCDAPNCSPPHRSFLVHPDDFLGSTEEKELSSSSLTTSQQQLQVLAQISSNTSAIAKKVKRTSRFVARTVTSPSTPIPSPPTTMSQQAKSPSPLNVGQQNVIIAETDSDGQLAEDNSFETVAEALKLQWSVIGNKTLAPVSPDVVAEIVAQAERRIKTGDSDTLLASSTPSSSPTPFTAEPNGSSPNPPGILQQVLSGPSQESRQGDCVRELNRIIPSEITTERSNSSSWFSGARSPAKEATKGGQESPGLSSGENRQVVSTSPPESTNVSEYTGENMSHRETSTASAGCKTDSFDTFSEASYSSELEMDKYLQAPLTATGINDYQLESEEFLRSLPPIKPIDLEAYATPPPLLSAQSLRRPKVQKSASDCRKPDDTDSAPTRKHDERKERKNLPSHDQESHSSSDAFSIPAAATNNSPSVPKATSLFSSGLMSIPEDESREFHSTLASSPQLETSLSQNSSYSTPGNNTLFYSASDSPSPNPFKKKHFDVVLKENAKLQGQMEILTEESQNLLQERAELQAQLVTLRGQISKKESLDSSASGDGRDLSREVENLRLSRQLLEQTVLDANRMLSEKAEEIRALQDELQVAQDTGNKLQVRSQEMRDDIRAKDMNIQALKNKIAELYVEVQNSIQLKMEAETESRTSQSDLVSLVKAKEWYQEQLQQAHEVRSRLQRELTSLQGQAVSHGTIVERLKTESGRLRQQLSEVQQRALRDKEMLARHLETIQGDMMEREAAFLEIQRERKMFEDTFNTQVLTAEEEQSRMIALQQATSDLEAQLDRAHSEGKKRHEQLVNVETGQMDTMKRLALAEDALGEKEKALEEMEQRLIQMESQLQALMSDLTRKDSETLKLKEEKASTEIALRSALQEKGVMDKALEVLKADMGKVEISFKHMKQELETRTNELQQSKVEREKLQEEFDRSQHELDIKSRSVDAMVRNFDGKNAAQTELEAEKSKLEMEVNALRLKIQSLEFDLSEKNRKILEGTESVSHLTTKVEELEAKVEATKNSVSADSIKMYESEIDDLRLKIRALEEVETEEANSLELERDRMRTEITRLKGELLERQKAYDENLTVMDQRLKEINNEKQQLETELGIARRSEELNMLEEKDSVTEELQNLNLDLKKERDERFHLEQKLLSVQAAKTAEITALQQQLAAENEALRNLQSQQGLLAEAEMSNQSLELELEKERGRVLGLSQKNTELKEHAHQLESVLAQRESTLEDLRCSVEESTRNLEQRDVKFLDRISGLEAAVQKEVDVQRELRRQMGTKIMENKRLKKHQESSKVELEQLRQDLVSSQQAATQALANLDSANQLCKTHQSEALQSSSHARSLEVELERVKRELSDNLARQPVLMDQIQSLEWQHAQKAKELESTQEQVKMAEVRAQEETDAVKAMLQTKQTELEGLQAELALLRQEKTQQRSQVNELRGALKASVQHHKLTKRLNENNGLDKGVQADMDRKVVIPALPFDLATVEKLIQDTKVTPLDSKPLDQLSSCLTSLRAEITGLQKEMDIHTTTVHTSSQSWRAVQSEVDDLNEVMKTIANTIIAANSTRTVTMATAVDREQAEVLHV